MKYRYISHILNLWRYDHAGIFKEKAFGSATVGERGQIVIPADLRETLNIKPGDRVMIFSKTDKEVISLMPAKDFTKFLEQIVLTLFIKTTFF